MEKAAELGIVFTFDNEETGFRSDFGTSSGNYQLIDHGDGKALHLNGGTEYLTVAPAAGPGVLAGEDELTVSFELKPDAGQDNWIFYSGSETDQKNQFGIVERDGKITVVAGHNLAVKAQTDFLAMNDWYHVSVRCTNDEVGIYVNGEEKIRQKGDFSIKELSDVGSVTYIGRGVSGDYHGLLDNVKIFGRALTKGEIKRDAASYSTEKLPEVLADFTFDDEDSGFQSENAIAAGEHTLISHDGGKALYLNGKTDFLRVTDIEGDSLIAGGLVNELTISLQVKAENKTGWVFYAAPDEYPQNYLYERYLGILDQNETTLAERYLNQGTRSSSAAGSTAAGEWHYLTIVYTQKEVIIYDNGEEKGRVENGTALSDILGSNSVIYIGKANWGNGEYFKGCIDNYKIVSRALSAEEVREAARKYTAIPAESPVPTAEPTESPDPTAEPTVSSNPAKIPAVTPDGKQPVNADTDTPEQMAEEIKEARQKNWVNVDITLIDQEITGRKSDQDIAGALYHPLRARVSKSTRNTNKVVWNKVAGADGYIIYGNQCGKKNTCVKLAEVKSTGRSYLHKKLKKSTFYKYIVVAYKTVKGKRVSLSVSKTVHVLTTGGKYGNARKIKTDKGKITLKKGKKYKIKAKEAKSTKKIKHHRAICYESGNTKVAAVTGKGVVRAKKKGTCTIYAYAQNGVCKTIKLTVK